MHTITGTITDFSSSSLVISAEMSSDQAIKDVQAQNAQFQELFLSLAKGQEDLKALILKEKEKEKKKKKKKKVVLLSMGKRFGDMLKQQADLSFSSKEGEDQEEEKGPVLQFLIMIQIMMRNNISLMRIGTSK